MSDPNNLMTAERNLAKPLAVLTIALVISGYFSLFLPGLSVVEQWTYLLHLLLGILVTLLLVPYIMIHFLRTLGLRRPWLSFSGLFSALAFLALAGSGIYIAVEGQSEALYWIFSGHVWLATITLILLALHIVFHALSLSDRRKKNEPNRFPSLSGGLFKITSHLVMAGTLLVLLTTGLYQIRVKPFKDTSAIKPYDYAYGSHPFRPAQTETSTGGFFDAKRLGNSERCATCHLEIAQQWKASIHAQAGSDKTYQTNIKLLSEKKGMAATRYCEGCHAPVALLSGQLSKGGKLDTPGHLQEGVSCMSCHGIDRVEHVKGVASYRFKPPEPYLFEGSQQALPTFVHNLLIRLKPEQHKADLSRQVLSTPELCATCHAQFMDKDFNDWGWVKMQDDYSAWLNSPYSGQTQQAFANGRPRRCQDCHFPFELGKDPSANQDGFIKTHFTIGANTAIPSVTQNQAQLERTRGFLRADQMRISIDRPNRPDATENNQHIDPKLIKSTEAPGYFYLGETVNIKVAVTNVQVGHAFPGGTTDINEAWIQFLVKDGQGRKIYESGYLKQDNNVEDNAYFYKSIPIDRIGNAVWRHDLFNMVGDSFKRIIPPGETDITSYSFKIPDDVKGPLIISASLNYRKLNNRYAKWALKDDKVELPVVEMAVASLLLPIKIKPEVTAIEP
ncbi:multiheme c-type cytochrome [Methylobacter psychrophilus]|uniref:multiheme c-type cytochrome n=1 Tax=Methylobacter psychrophilus TaxID=96941 RepID=UPI0021D51890|nr:multiheme c-type cytochrome [Methylobacter psychrophilus]